MQSLYVQYHFEGTEEWNKGEKLQKELKNHKEEMKRTVRN